MRSPASPADSQFLDRITYGWQPTDLIILAARPSVGKTAFALNLARNAALASDQTTARRVLQPGNELRPACSAYPFSAESEIFMEKIARGRLEEHEMKQLYAKGIRPPGHRRRSSSTIHAALNIFELRAKCRRLKNKHNVGLIIIDYLQLMSGTGDNRNGNREQEISRISRDLKGLAKEFQVPIIALSQLSRAVEYRKEGEKIPQLSDLRESGAIEQDADMVMFLYRPEYYGITANEIGESNKGETHVQIAKHRNGSLETIKLRALLHIQKFIDDEGSDFNGLPPGGNWKPVPPDEQGGPKLYIQAGSKMNDIPFNEEDPF